MYSVVTVQEKNNRRICIASNVRAMVRGVGRREKMRDVSYEAKRLPELQAVVLCTSA
jgi:hypothetical protein